MDVARIDDHGRSRGRTRRAQEGCAAIGRERRRQAGEVGARLQQHGRQPGGQALQQPLVDHGGPHRPGHQCLTLGEVRRGVQALGGLAQVGEVILVVLQVHQVGDRVLAANLGDGLAGGLAGRPAEHGGPVRLEITVEADDAGRIAGEVSQAEGLDRRRDRRESLARADGDGIAAPGHLIGEGGDVPGAVALKGPVGDEHHRLQAAPSPDAAKAAQH